VGRVSVRGTRIRVTIHCRGVADTRVRGQIDAHCDTDHRERDGHPPGWPHEDGQGLPQQDRQTSACSSRTRLRAKLRLYQSGREVFTRRIRSGDEPGRVGAVAKPRRTVSSSVTAPRRTGLRSGEVAASHRLRWRSVSGRPARRPHACDRPGGRVAHQPRGAFDLAPNTWVQVALIVVGAAVAVALALLSPARPLWGGATALLFAA